jgi:tight adherence protein B
VSSPPGLAVIALYQESRHRLGRADHRAFLPYSRFVSYRRQKRFEKFEELFPEAIDTLARAVRAGHAFTTALEMISNEIADPLATEFRKLFEEQKFGMPVRDALMNLAERVPLVDVKFFVTAVMLQRETGGNLAEILDNLSYVIRERFKIQRQVRVHTAQGRLTMALLMAMPPTVVAILFVFSPEFVAPLFTIPSATPSWWPALLCRQPAIS